MENYGSSQSPLFVQDSLVEQYPPNNPLSTGGFNVPRFSDIDADNDLDMFVGILGGAVSLTANIVDNFFFGNDEGLEDDVSFLEEGIIDSTGVLELVNFIEEEFDLCVDDDELVPENLDSINNVVGYIGRKLGTT